MAIKVIVLDDIPAYIDALKRALRPEYEVEGADNVEDAMTLAKSMNPDLALVDVRLEGEGSLDRLGLEFVKKLHEHSKDISIIVLSEVQDADLPEAALNAGADLFIKRPVGGYELRGKIENLLASKKSQST